MYKMPYNKKNYYFKRQEIVNNYILHFGILNIAPRKVNKRQKYYIMFLFLKYFNYVNGHKAKSKRINAMDVFFVQKCWGATHISTI